MFNYLYNFSVDFLTPLAHICTRISAEKRIYAQTCATLIVIHIIKYRLWKDKIGKTRLERQDWKDKTGKTRLKSQDKTRHDILYVQKVWK